MGAVICSEPVLMDRRAGGLAGLARSVVPLPPASARLAGHRQLVCGSERRRRRAARRGKQRPAAGVGAHGFSYCRCYCGCRRTAAASPQPAGLCGVADQPGGRQPRAAPAVGGAGRRRAGCRTHAGAANSTSDRECPVAQVCAHQGGAAGIIVPSNPTGMIMLSNPTGMTVLSSHSLHPFQLLNASEAQQRSVFVATCAFFPSCRST